MQNTRLKATRNPWPLSETDFKWILMRWNIFKILCNSEFRRTKCSPRKRKVFYRNWIKKKGLFSIWKETKSVPGKFMTFVAAPQHAQSCLFFKGQVKASFIRLKPASFKASSVQIGSTTADHVGAAVLAIVVRSSRSALDAAHLEWKGLMTTLPLSLLHAYKRCVSLM